jgi:ferric-dicitrate binding protein FerR (iron transport regulator)
MAQTGKPPEQYQIEDFVTDESFVNYFFHLNAEDVVFWEKWLLANPACKETVDTAKEMLRSLTLTLSDQEIADETARLKTSVGFDTDLKKRPAIVRVLPTVRTRRFARVAALLILLAGGYLIYRTTHAEHPIEKFNDGNNPIVFSLADGTTVTLAPHSSLRYDEGFGDKERTVFLDGEAQFNVSRKTDHPFEVREKEIKVTVLGTIFSVKAPSGDSLMVVELIRGKLKVENSNTTGLPMTSIILNPDERAVYNRHDQRLYKERWQPQTDLPIQVGHILFQRNNFDEIAAKIKIDFGITLINQSKRRNWMFSGEFENATAEEIIKNICVVERLNFETTGDTILIK